MTDTDVTANRANLRLLTATPREILSWTAPQLRDAIRRSEGRTLLAYARTRSANLVDHVSNAELAAGFGADVVMMNCYDSKDPIVPGLPSADPAADAATQQIQVPLGAGVSLHEVKALIGRPVGVLLVHTQESDDAGQQFSYGDVPATVENAVGAVESGANLLCFLGWGSDREALLANLGRIRAATGDRALIEFFRPHGPGLMGLDGRTGEHLVDEDEIGDIVAAGADIVGIPTPASHYGWTVERARRMVSVIHEHGALASVGIHTSQEGADDATIRQLAIYAKMTGADIHELGDIGYNESMVPPENILTYGVAIRGRRHQYRRMSMSINR